MVVKLKFQFNTVFEIVDKWKNQSEIKGKNEILKMGKRRKEKKRLERWLIYQWDKELLSKGEREKWEERVFG